MPSRLALAGLAVLTLALAALNAQPSKPAAKPPPKSDVETVERLLAARKEYQTTLEMLRAHYIATGDIEKARWAEEELLQYHRITKQAFDLKLDAPPPTLTPRFNIPEANELYRRAIAYKDKGWGNDYVDNQRRAELLLQTLLTSYPQSDKIDDAAYQLGDIYESKANKMYARAAVYFERCFEWNPKTHFDARMRAARLYERYLNERNRAIEIYKEITSHETDAARVEEAQRRLTELGAKK
jgi:TolA-binding protein